MARWLSLPEQRFNLTEAVGLDSRMYGKATMGAIVF
jgi:hypothetical protein